MAWVPEDLLLRDEFCSLSDYKSIVADELRRAEHEVLYLIPFTDFTLFRRLAHGSQFQKLRPEDFKFGHPVVAGQLLTVLDKMRSHNDDADPLGCTFLKRVAELISNEGVELHVVKAASKPETLKLLCLTRGSRIPDDAFLRILATANGTSLAAVNKADRYRRMSNRAFGSTAVASVDQLLEMVVEQVYVEGAAVYVHQPHFAHLELYATRRKSDSRLYFPRLMSSTNSPAEMAVEERTHLRGDGDADTPPDWELYVDELDARETGFDELALPIDMLAARPTSKSRLSSKKRWGALSLLIPKSAELGPNDLYFLHTIATRMSIAFEYDQRKSDLNYVSARVERMQPEEAEHDSNSVARVITGPHIPLPYKNCVSGIASIVASAAKSLRADVASVRIITGGTNGHSRLELNRIALWPATLPEDDHLPIPLDHPTSVNARAIASGKSQYVKHLHDKRLAGRLSLQHRADSNSELAVPIRGDRGLIGTLNFEARDSDGFEGVEATARLFASLVGLELSRAEGEVALRVVESAIHLKANLHVIDETVAILSTLVEDSQYKPLARHLEEAASHLKPIGYNKSRRRAATELIGARFVDLLAGAAKTHDTHLQFRITDDDRFRYFIRPSDVELVRSALLDIFAKVSELSGKKNHRRKVFRKTVRIDGVKSEVYGLRYATGQLLDEDLPSQVYWQPVPRSLDIRDNEREHLGSYLAASALRASGVNIWLSRLDPRNAAVWFLCSSEGLNVDEMRSLR